MKQLARPSQIATENGVDAFMKERHGPGSMTLRRWFDYEALSFATIAGALNALGLTVADMGALWTATLVGADKPPYAKNGEYRAEPPPGDLRQLDNLLARFESALGTPDEAGFVRRLTDENVAALRESAELDYFGRAVEASEGTEHWAQTGVLLVLMMIAYQWVSILLWRTSYDALTYTVPLLAVAVFFIVVVRPRGPITITLDWARSWADPERKLNSWRGRYYFSVPALIATIVGTFVVPLFLR